MHHVTETKAPASDALRQAEVISMLATVRSEERSSASDAVAPAGAAWVALVEIDDGAMVVGLYRHEADAAIACMEAAGDLSVSDLDVPWHGAPRGWETSYGDGLTRLCIQGPWTIR